MATFHNPYNFVPTPPRPATDSRGLGDGAPAGHGRYYDDLWSGTIQITVQAVTPLLIMDEAPVIEAKGHKMLTTRRAAGTDEPLLTVSTFKGTLRSAYETVTNSRYGVFSHDRRLGYRPAASAGLRVIPAVYRSKGGAHGFDLYPGLSTVGSHGPAREEAAYAAWLPFHGRRLSWEHDERAVSHADHGKPVHCIVELVQHWSWDAKQRRYSRPFTYWKVRAVARSAQRLPRTDPELTEPPPEASGWRTKRKGPSRTFSVTQSNGTGKFARVQGVLCITAHDQPNAPGKHDERVFFLPPGERPLWASATNSVIDHFDALMASYVSAHTEAELASTPTDAGAGGTPAGWSAHLIDPDRQTLRDGSPCYVTVKRVDGSWTVGTVSPVIISRDLYDKPPIEFLDPSLRPATRLGQCSPADRVFGWAGGEGAHRGQLRIQAIDGTGATVEPAGRTLVELASPKPSQARFYWSPANGSWDASYSGEGSLRGRKVYPFQEPEDGQPFTDEATKRNVTVKDWVGCGSAFVVDMDVVNLSAVELGALLWLLEPVDPDEGLPRLRVGRGKPLGYGALCVTDRTLVLGTGEQTRLRYRTAFDEGGEPVSSQPLAALATVDQYKRAIADAYGAAFEEVEFIAAFEIAATGHSDDDPSHYPRRRPEGDDEPYRWWKDQVLPPLPDDRLSY